MQGCSESSFAAQRTEGVDRRRFGRAGFSVFTCMPRRCQRQGGDTLDSCAPRSSRGAGHVVSGAVSLLWAKGARAGGGVGGERALSALPEFVHRGAGG